ncbi:hypothetical protein GCM10023166_00540 [Paeniglutamicibacter cryotolerans]
MASAVRAEGRAPIAGGAGEEASLGGGMRLMFPILTAGTRRWAPPRNETAAGVGPVCGDDAGGRKVPVAGRWLVQGRDGRVVVRFGGDFRDDLGVHD